MATAELDLKRQDSEDDIYFKAEIIFMHTHYGLKAASRRHYMSSVKRNSYSVETFSTSVKRNSLAIRNPSVRSGPYPSIQEPRLGSPPPSRIRFR